MVAASTYVHMFTRNSASYAEVGIYGLLRRGWVRRLWEGKATGSEQAAGHLQAKLLLFLQARRCSSDYSAAYRPVTPRSCPAHRGGGWSQLLAKSHAFFQALCLCPWRELFPNTALCDNLPAEESWQQCFDLGFLQWVSDRKIFSSTRQTYVLIFISLLLIRAYIIYLCRNRAVDNYMLFQYCESVSNKKQKKACFRGKLNFTGKFFPSNSSPPLMTATASAQKLQKASFPWWQCLNVLGCFKLIYSIIQFQFITTKGLFLQVTRNWWQ